MVLKLGAGAIGFVLLGAMFFSVLAMSLAGSTGMAGMGGGNGQVASSAQMIVGHLQCLKQPGPCSATNPDSYYDKGMPQAVLNFWQKACPVGTGCFANWQQGTLQCVMLITAAYAVAGTPLPAAGNAIDFWNLYKKQPSWTEIPAISTAAVAQRGLPAPGDIMVWSDDPAFVGEAFGHVAIVLSVTAPAAGKDGSVTFAEANGPGAVISQALAPDLTVRTWPHYSVLGYIRSPFTSIGTGVAGRVVRISQLDPAQYGSTAEYNTWAYSACSTAVITELLDAYGGRYRIHDILAVEAARGDITPNLGLVSEPSFADTVGQFGLQTTWGHRLSLDQVIAVANGGVPVAVSFPPDRYQGGHLLIVTGGNATSVMVIDSSAHNFSVLSQAQFLAWWGGFSAIVAPTKVQVP
jgi:CHAP domain